MRAAKRPRTCPAPAAAPPPVVAAAAPAEPLYDADAETSPLVLHARAAGAAALAPRVLLALPPSYDAARHQYTGDGGVVYSLRLDARRGVCHLVGRDQAVVGACDLARGACELDAAPAEGGQGGGAAAAPDGDGGGGAGAEPVLLLPARAPGARRAVHAVTAGARRTLLGPDASDGADPQAYAVAPSGRTLLLAYNDGGAGAARICLAHLDQAPHAVLRLLYNTHNNTDPPGVERLETPMEMAVCRRDERVVYVCDYRGHAVRRLTYALLLRPGARDPVDYRASLATVAGGGAGAGPGHRDGRGAEARFAFPRAVAELRSGLLIVGEDDHLRTLTPDGLAGTLCARGLPRNVSRLEVDADEAALLFVDRAAQTLVVLDLAGALLDAARAALCPPAVPPLLLPPLVRLVAAYCLWGLPPAPAAGASSARAASAPPS